MQRVQCEQRGAGGHCQRAESNARSGTFMAGPDEPTETSARGVDRRRRTRVEAITVVACTLVVSALLFRFGPGFPQAERSQTAQTLPKLKSLRINDVSEVQYGEGASEMDARIVGAALLRMRLLTTTERRIVALTKEDAVFVLTIPVLASMTEGDAHEIEQIARVAAGALRERATMRLVLCHHETGAISRASFVTPLRPIALSPTATVYASPSVSDDEVRDVGAWLVEDGYFDETTAMSVALERVEGEFALLVPLGPREAISEEAMREARAMANRLAAYLEQPSVRLSITTASFAVHTRLRGTSERPCTDASRG
ncbi:MAG: hypothetical protein JNK05_22560 [Myxococcales bacterium]|nr:hypothetical protein [Myxococcales bacterium]